MFLTRSILVAFVASFAAASPFLALRQDDNDGIHLAVSPRCGPLGGNTSDVNAGIDLKSIKTIVSFGDSYTDGGKHDGSPLLPPIVIPPNPEAGGRSTNGPVWIEDIANDLNATIMDYAVASACVNISLTPDNARPVDFLQQMAVFLGQSNNLDSDSTLYTLFFGINDFVDIAIDGDHMVEAAQQLLGQIKILASAPTNGRSFLVTDVYGRGTHTPPGEAWKQTIFDGLSAFHKGTDVAAPLNVAFVDFDTIWDSVLGPNPPGYKAYGYTSTDFCVGSSTDDECSDPEHYFYWIQDHPSKETMRIMADFVEEALDQCSVA